MSKKQSIKQAVIRLYVERGKWEVEKSRDTDTPIMETGYTSPIVEYLPGKGFSINGVEWPYTAEYIMEDFNRRADEYQRETERLIADREARGVVNEDSDLPF